MSDNAYVSRVEWTDTQGFEWQVSLRFAMVGGKVRCTGFTLGSTSDEKPVTTTILRSVPVGRLIDDVLRDPPRELYRLADLPPFNTLQRLAEVNLSLLKPREDALEPSLPRGRPRKYGADHYAEVARVYLGATRRPTATVAAHFDVSPTSAANWVRTARELGLLESNNGETGQVRSTEEHE